MLTAIRDTFAKGFARYVLYFIIGLLIVSFAIWGIQDVFSGFRSTEVARVGNAKIEQDVFQRQYNREIQDLSRRIGTSISADEARQLGLDRQVLGRLVTNAVLDERARAYGLGLPMEKVATLVQTDPAFFGGGSRFNRDYFNAVIREAGLTEQGFFVEQRAAYKRAQIGEALGGEAFIPRAMQEAFARFGSETRGVSYVTLPATLAGAVPDPDDATLSGFFEERKGEFRAPEYRKFTWMALSPDMVAATIAVTDADAKADYDARIDRYTTPERRRVQQIAFPTEADAAAAAARLTSGAITFDALALERNVAAADLDLGLVARSQMLDPVIAEAVFALAPNQPSAPVRGNLSTVIARVTAIEPAVVTPFDTVKDEIRKAIAAERARSQILDIQGRIEDARASGQTLQEIAPQFGLTATEVAASDETGLDDKDQPVSLPVARTDLLRGVFATDVGVEADVVDARDQGFVWFTVDGVTPSRDRTLEEARPRVVEAWKRAETDRLLRVKADELVAAARGGASLDDIARDNTLEVKQAWNLQRGQAAQGLSADAINLIFSTAKDGYGQAAGTSAGERVLFRLTEVLVPTFDPAAPATTALRDQLAAQFGQDVLNQYVLRSQNDLGLQINQLLVDQAIGIRN